MLYPLSFKDGVPSPLGVIEPGDGPIARIRVELVSDTLTATSRYAETNLVVTLNPIAFADDQGMSVPACPTFIPMAGVICVRNSASACDINGDGRSDVVDIVNMIKCIMCPIPEGCCTPDQVARADCNGDGMLNVTDVVCCIRRILDSFCNWCVLPGGGQAGAGQASVGLSQEISWDSGTSFTVPIKFSSQSSTGGVEARIAYDPAVLAVENVTMPGAPEGTELYYKAAGGELSIMIVALGSNPFPIGESGVLAQVAFAYVPGSSDRSTEIHLTGAAGADNEGSRLEVQRSGDSVEIQPQIAPVVRLASRPNPFLSSTDVSLSLPSGQDGTLAIFDVAGRLVRTLRHGYFPEGVQSFSWDGISNSGARVRSGVYFVRFEGSAATLVSKLVLLKSQ